MAELEVGVADGVLRVRFNRPEVYNAFSAGMSDEVAALLEEVPARDDVRVVLLTGTGRAFSTGADISGATPADAFDAAAMDRASRVVRAVTSCDRPVVAAVNGVAAGVGCSLALACDLAVAAESASFLLAFTRIGLMPDGGTSAVVAAHVGRARAMRMALLAEALPARAAYDAGLVSHLAPDASFPDEVEELLARLAAGPPLAYAATKKAVNAATLTQLDPALAREHRGQTVLFGTADVAEGMAAFSAKRSPLFRGE